MRKLVAILRGVKPTEAIEVTRTLIESGVLMIEVPMNSPSPFASIQAIAENFHQEIIVGAGTVTEPEQVEKLSNIGCQLVLSPDCNPEVIRLTKHYHMQSIPGVFTPTECFTALRNGADALKLFPSFCLGPTGVQAMRAVLPTETQFFAVGGVSHKNFSSWFGAGVTGFGIGTAIYQAGDSMQVVRKKAKSIVAAYDQAVSTTL